MYFGKGYWIGFAVGILISMVVITLLASAFGADFWRGAFVSFFIIMIGSQVGMLIEGKDK